MADSQDPPIGSLWNWASTLSEVQAYLGGRLVSPNGTHYRLSVDNTGALTAVPVDDVVTPPDEPPPEPEPDTTLAPSITQQPSDATVHAGTDGTGWVVGVSYEPTTPVPTAQWQESTDAGATWHDHGAPETAHASYLVLGVVDLTMDGYQYRVTFSNEGGSTTSNVATLTVGPPIEYYAYSAPTNFRQGEDGPNYTAMTVAVVSGSDGSSFDVQDADGTSLPVVGARPDYVEVPVLSNGAQVQVRAKDSNGHGEWSPLSEPFSS